MMGNDWREFRAKLVAQEKSHAAGNGESGDASGNDRYDISKREENHEKRLQWNTQGQLDPFFGGEISSILSRNNKASSKSKDKIYADRKKRSSGISIFDGDSIGGASSSSVSDFESPSFYQSTGAGAAIEDPFVSAAELPCHLQPTSPKINKHRWAHEIPHVEPGSVLIANEKIDGVFHQTVILVLLHNERVGSIGIVINR
jgi:putative transcriptional regulator